MSSSCAVCMESLAAQIAALPCGHVFHAECALSWMQQQRSQPGHQTSCALCKAPCNTSDVMRFSFEPMERIRRYLERSEAEAEQEKKQTQQKADSDDMSDVEVIDVEAAPSTTKVPTSSPVLLSPLLFQLRLSGIEESITQAKERMDLINPQFHTLLQRFTDISEHAKTESAAAVRLREESDQIKAQTELNKALFVAKNTKLESLQRAKAVLAKHRISWIIIQECVRREETHLANAESAARTAESNWDRSRSHLLKHELTMHDDEQPDDHHLRAEGEPSSNALTDERNYERNVAYSSHLLHASTAGTFDPERHPLLNSNGAKENGRSTRLHLLKMQAAFLSRRIEDLSQSRSQASFIQNAKNEEKQMELRAMEARLRSQQEEYRKRKERVESLGYELERIREERNTDPSRLSQPAATLARKPASSKPSSMDAPAVATVVRSSDLAQNKRKREEGPRESSEDLNGNGNNATPRPSSSSLPHAAYRERPRTSTTVSSLLSPTPSQPTFSLSPPPASQQHGLIATHRVLPHNHRQLAELEQEKEMEEILTELWQD